MGRLESFVDVSEVSDFPLENIPFGVFKPLGSELGPRCATAVGEYVVDLSVLADAGLIAKSAKFESARDCFSKPYLNDFMSLGRPAWKEVREELQTLLSKETATLRDNTELREKVFWKQSEVELLLPAQIGDYTDFYASKEHATNVGTMFRGKENALMPNWVHLPVGYHGRASSVVVSGVSLHRPKGQLKPEEGAPVHAPSKLVDFEMEMGFFVGVGNELGHPISMENAKDHIFGVTLMNDWSARDIQKWEYVPLGPFGAKNFGTTISPWIVTLDALEPFLTENPPQEPTPLEYLRQDKPGAYDINLEVALRADGMEEPHTVCRTNMKYMYWSIMQQLVHHTVTGCNMRPGDLCGTGTISGPTEESYGSMLELTWRGSKPLQLPNGDTRKFIQDGDTICMRGFCQGDGFRIGFGSCDGKILPALE